MSFLRNLNAGISGILVRAGKDAGLDFEVRVNNWEIGDRALPEYFGTCKVTPEFLRAFRNLCEKHKCGEE